MGSGEGEECELHHECWPPVGHTEGHQLQRLTVCSFKTNGDALQELKNGRLAMLAFAGAVTQAELLAGAWCHNRCQGGVRDDL